MRCVNLWFRWKCSGLLPLCARALLFEINKSKSLIWLEATSGWDEHARPSKVPLETLL